MFFGGGGKVVVAHSRLFPREKPEIFFLWALLFLQESVCTEDASMVSRLQRNPPGTASLLGREKGQSFHKGNGRKVGNKFMLWLYVWESQTVFPPCIPQTFSYPYWHPALPPLQCSPSEQQGLKDYSVCCSVSIHKMDIAHIWLVMVSADGSIAP